ncbi:hypothetical protein [Actinoplanes sp. CA-252034]|uniref:hypothetical protein n=1 Tax=Actinoplanes sp. CA-252034 TaxID=3239906 RepID=UPI003D95263B
MVRGVVFFDVDGTLVPGTSSGQFLAGLLGHAPVVREAEAAYAAGTLTNQEVSVLDARGWRGHEPSRVAFNATPAARAAAHVSADGDDLRAVLPPLATWLEMSARQP